MKDTETCYRDTIFRETTQKLILPLKLDNGEFDDMKNELERLRRFSKYNAFLSETSEEKLEKNIRVAVPLLNKNRKMAHFINAKRQTVKKHKNVRTKRKADCCSCTIS